MKVFISGAGGSLGQKVIKLLAKDLALEIIAISSRKRKSQENLHYIDLSDLARVSAKGFFDNSLILHLAFARSSDSQEISRSLAYLHDFFSLVRESSNYRIINVSSQSVYDGHRKKPAEETDLPQPANLYGWAKLYSEEWLAKFAAEEEVKLVNLRLASLIGQDFPKRLPTRLMRSALDQGQINIKTGGEVFSFLDIEDAARGLVSLVYKGQELEGTYNLGSQESYNLLQLADTINKLLVNKGHEKAEIIAEESHPPFANNSLSTDKLSSQLDWKEELGIYGSLEKTYISLGELNE